MTTGTNSISKFSEAFCNTIKKIHGRRGEQWLKNLPEQLEYYKTKWALTLEHPFQNLTYHYVVAGTRNHQPIVLKLGVPTQGFSTSVEALIHFQTGSSVSVLEHEADNGAVLLERVFPGELLHLVQQDSEAVVTAARVMKSLWKAPPKKHSFTSITDWLSLFQKLRNQNAGTTGPFPEHLIEIAEQTFAELITSSENQVVLHGDLHHENILSCAKRGFIAIDPAGVIGESGYEIGSFMRNKLPQVTSERSIIEVLNYRVGIFSKELDFSEARLKKWTFCHIILSSVWSYENSEDYSKELKLAELLYREGWLGF